MGKVLQKAQLLKPCRELDALVAEKVMGCKVLRHKYPDGNREWLSCGCDVSQQGYHPHDLNDDGPASDMLNWYSTDIAAAWQVVERLISMGFYPGLIWGLDMNSNKTVCRFYSNYPHTTWAQEESAPQAICIAALKAVGVNVESPSQ